MSKIRLDADHTLVNGESLTFNAPCACNNVDGIIVYYPDANGAETSKAFVFTDSHGNDLTGLGNLFTSGVHVKVILDTVNGRASIQNADTNKYLENKFTNLQSALDGKAASSHNHSASNITSGTLPVARGGTGKSSYTANRLLYPSASTTMAQLAFPTVAGSVLRQNTSGAPFWTSPTDLLTAIGGQAKLPSGLICLWSGASTAIPNDWALCDGTNGTPDLRDRFIVGAGKSYAVGAVGGASSVTLTTNQIPAHSHSGGSLTADSAGAHTHTYNKATSSSKAVSAANGNGGLVSISSGSATGSSGAHTHSISGSTDSTGGGQAHENRPPYYALCYIMKL